jgi:hypothetical protein
MSLRELGLFAELIFESVSDWRAGGQHERRAIHMCRAALLERVALWRVYSMLPTQSPQSPQGRKKAPQRLAVSAFSAEAVCVEKIMRSALPLTGHDDIISIKSGLRERRSRRATHDIHNQPGAIFFDIGPEPRGGSRSSARRSAPITRLGL